MNYQGADNAFDSARTNLISSRTPSTGAESTKAEGLARDKVRNCGGSKECRFLSPSQKPPVTNSGHRSSCEKLELVRIERRTDLELEMALDKLAEVFAVVVAHV